MKEDHATDVFTLALLLLAQQLAAKMEGLWAQSLG